MNCGDSTSLSSGPFASELPIDASGGFQGTLSSTGGLEVSIAGMLSPDGGFTGSARMLSSGAGYAPLCDTGPLTWTAAYQFAPTPAPILVRVPQLVGLTLGAAERHLRELGLDAAPPDAPRYEPASSPDAYQNDVVAVRSDGADLRVVGQDLAPGTQVAVGSWVGLSTVRAPGPPQNTFAESVGAFALARDDRTLTIRFRELPARCRPLDHVDVVPHSRWVIVRVIIILADSPACQQSPELWRSVRLVLPSRLAGRPLLNSEPVFPDPQVIASSPVPWSGYLSPDHRTAVINFLYGACEVLAGIKATVTNGIAHITIYEGATQTFLPCVAIGLFGETYVRLPRAAQTLAGGRENRPFTGHIRLGQLRSQSNDLEREADVVAVGALERRRFPRAGIEPGAAR
ncbi:MAG: PASTA domain-containing protein [Solirubrobacteraceae bacterium]